MSITDILGIDLPVIQAPMAGVQGSALALAVAKAGGLGSLPCAMLNATQIQNELQTLQQHTNKPININFFCHSQPAPDQPRNQRWLERLDPYFHEFDVDPHTVPNQASREPFSDAIADIIEPFQPQVISFHFGLPEKGLLQRVKGWGTKVLSSATTVVEAQWLEQHGADVIIAQGIEAGGHRGMFLSNDLNSQTGTLALLPQIVDAVRVPVIAAGGIVDERSARAAMSLGARGVQAGSAYLLCPETNTTALHRDAIKQTRSRETALTNVFSGRPARSIVNRAMIELGPISDEAPAFPLAGNAMGLLRKAAEAQQSSDFSPLWCGANASACQEVSAAQVTRHLASGMKAPENSIQRA